MKEKLEYTNAKIIVMDKYENITVNKPLIKIPLQEKVYEIEGKKLFGISSPCILERRRIEYNLCSETASKLDNGKRYRSSEIEWLMEIYNLKGDYITVIY